MWHIQPVIYPSICLELDATKSFDHLLSVFKCRLKTVFNQAFAEQWSNLLPVTLKLWLYGAMEIRLSSLLLTLLLLTKVYALSASLSSSSKFLETTNQADYTFYWNHISEAVKYIPEANILSNESLVGQILLYVRDVPHAKRQRV